MRHIIIGDVHGCLDELKELINDLSILNTDLLYFLGDLIDRGPNTVGVIKLIYQLSKQNKTILILGNHEEKLLRYINHKNNLNDSAFQMTGTENFEYYLANLQQQEIDFLADSYINYNIPNTDICLIHGGVPENISIDLKIDHQYSSILPLKNRKMFLLLKTRYLDTVGKFIPFGEESVSSSFWAERYDGRFGKILFGHHSLIGKSPMIFKHAINMDTGCVFGGWLSACIIEDGNIYFRSVRAKKAYF